MPFWRTRIYLTHNKGCVTTQEITFNRSIFQGDSLFSFLLLLEIEPLTHILKCSGVGYRTHNKIVSHLLYMDDMKVYAGKTKYMGICKEMIEGFIKDICMEFGLDKCAVVHTKGGVIFD